MNAWDRLLTSLHGTVATTASKILLWLQIRQLLSALDDLFNAWRAGELPSLPPVPAPLQVEPVRTPPIRRASTTRRVRTRTPQSRPVHTEFPAAAAATARAGHPIPPTPAPHLPRAQAAPIPNLKKTTPQRTGETCALNVPFKQHYSACAFLCASNAINRLSRQASRAA